jgi:glucosyl-3-phosphoglycerate phosphatase
MQTRVWLLRHAQTDRPQIFHGAESDTELSELGYRQAETIAPVIASYQPHVIIASGMIRAQKTAHPIAKACGLPLHTEPYLHERKVGDLVGKPSQGEFGVWPDTLQRWLNGEPHFAPPGSESFVDMQQRILPIHCHRSPWDCQPDHFVVPGERVQSGRLDAHRKS